MDGKENNSEKSDFARREEDVLAFWNSKKIFKKSLEKDAPHGEYVFYDGPPFATGLPHYGHILAGTIKDAIPRYQTMRGYRVRRTWGWDCHGLPLENQIEAKLGIKTKREIEELGVEKFNQAAKEAVLEYADDWKRIIPRLGRWADMDHDYKTMDATYTESVWWVFKTLFEKGLVYEGFKSMHLCPRCGTTLSNFEVNLGYKDIKDIAVTVKLELVDEPNTHLLVWTTTPWTLPGNMAAAVHEEYDYVKAEVTKEDGSTEKIITAKAKAAPLFESLNLKYSIIEEFKGSDLVGKSYKPPFEYFKDREIEGKENAWKIYHAPYVTLEDGTGAVHLAPAYGEEDMVLAKTHKIPIVHHVGEDGRFRDFITDFAGALVKPKDDEASGVTHLDADIQIVKALAAKGILFKKENITHSYPLCWRCDTPLLNYATTSWFIEVTKIRDELVAENNKIHWVPEHVGRARFGNWLENARDWSVSRQRYWGAPLPVWKNPENGTYKVIGSLRDLQAYIKRSGNTYTMMRHGTAENNEANVVSSKIDSPYALTEEGRREVEGVVSELKEKKIDLVVASPLLRTKQTAEIIAEHLGLSVEAVIYDERIREIGMGELEGKPSEQYWKFWSNVSERFVKRPEGGENLEDVLLRTGAFLYDLEHTYSGKNILIVGHDTPLLMLHAVSCGCDRKALIALKEQGEFFMDNGTVRTLDFVPMPHNRMYELDYHKPFIDEIELYDEDGTKLMRVIDVFDCWYESGSMPYGERHYPFENLDVFDAKKGVGYPADFIAESVDQTRGWFYSLLVLGVALFGKSPYKNVITNGLVLAEDGKKMSKKLKNYPDPLEVVSKYGADTIRFYLLSSPIIRGEDLNFTERSVAELARKNIGRLDNVLAFYELYKHTSEHDCGVPEVTHALDRWMLARLSELTTEITAGYEQYELDRATKPLTDFIDDLSTWYIRRSRDRFKSDDTVDRCAALATTRYVLRETARLIAPSMPFYADYLYGKVKGDEDPESVHLDMWPEAGEADTALIADMRVVREIVAKALEARSTANVKVRQPLAHLTVSGKDINLDDALLLIIKEEVNVKDIEVKEGESLDVVLDTDLTDALKQEGEIRDLMRYIQDMRKEAGLVPHDAISLTLDSDAEGKAAVETFKDVLLKTVNAKEFIFGSDGAEAAIGGRTYRVAIKKL